jgi:hypothetical protein
VAMVSITPTITNGVRRKTQPAASGPRSGERAV